MKKKSIYKREKIDEFLPCFLALETHPLRSVSLELAAASYASPTHFEHI